MVGIHRVADGHPDLRHHAVGVGLDPMLHLHGLEDDQRVAFGNRITRADQHAVTVPGTGDTRP